MTRFKPQTFPSMAVVSQQLNSRLDNMASGPTDQQQSDIRRLSSAPAAGVLANPAPATDSAPGLNPVFDEAPDGSKNILMQCERTSAAQPNGFPRKPALWFLFCFA